MRNAAPVSRKGKTPELLSLTAFAGGKIGPGESLGLREGEGREGGFGTAGRELGGMGLEGRRWG